MRALVAGVLCLMAAEGVGGSVESVARFDEGIGTNGWTVAANGERIVSPVWRSARLRSVEVELQCSTETPDRWLAVSLLHDGKAVSGPLRAEGVYRAGVREWQSFPVGRNLRANGVALTVAGEGAAEWRVHAIRLVAEMRKEAGFRIQLK